MLAKFKELPNSIRDHSIGRSAIYAIKTGMPLPTPFIDSLKVKVPGRSVRFRKAAFYKFWESILKRNRRQPQTRCRMNGKDVACFDTDRMVPHRL